VQNPGQSPAIGKEGCGLIASFLTRLARAGGRRGEEVVQSSGLCEEMQDVLSLVWSQGTARLVSIPTSCTI
jgi:disulfide bond formation protein DsbB